LTRRRELNQASPDQLSYEARPRRSRPTKLLGIVVIQKSHANWGNAL
jgi:hypothetical protein